MSKHYILRVGDGNNFKNSSNVSIWAVKLRNKSFLKKVKEGDKLWFVKNKEKGDIYNGKIIAVADFVSKNERIVGPLISITPNNDELGWDDKGGFYDVEIHYNNLYNLTDCNLFTGQNNQTTICEYDNIKTGLLVNLIVEYEYISKYSKITKTM
jgi:hypothetical protein